MCSLVSHNGGTEGLRNIPGSTRDEELYDLYCQTKYISGDQRMRWLGNMVHTGEMRHALRLLVAKLERKNHL
jgi:hypothetical protein